MKKKKKQKNQKEFFTFTSLHPLKKSVKKMNDLPPELLVDIFNRGSAECSRGARCGATRVMRAVCARWRDCLARSLGPFGMAHTLRYYVECDAPAGVRREILAQRARGVR